MIVPDTSAWIEYLRRSGHPVALRLRQLIDERADLAVTEVVLMEVLAGRRSGEHAEQARSLLVARPVLRLEGVNDFERAAALYRVCRDAGHTLRSQLDLLIAIPVIRHGASLLHNDRDFEVIARHSDLKLEPIKPADQREVKERKGKYTRSNFKRRMAPASI